MLFYVSRGGGVINWVSNEKACNDDARLDFGRIRSECRSKTRTRWSSALYYRSWSTRCLETPGSDLRLGPPPWLRWCPYIWPWPWLGWRPFMGPWGRPWLARWPWIRVRPVRRSWIRRWPARRLWIRVRPARRSWIRRRLG